MQHTLVTSSQIRSIGFDNADDGDVMEIQFHDKDRDKRGAVYRYTGPKVFDHYTALLAEDQRVDAAGQKIGSVGAYFGKNVRHCKETKCVRVTDV